MTGDLIPPHTYTAGDLLTAASLNDFLLKAKIKDDVVKFSHFTKKALEELEDFFNKRFYSIGDIVITKTKKSPAEKFGGEWRLLPNKLIHATNEENPDSNIEFTINTFQGPDWSRARTITGTSHVFDEDGWLNLVYRGGWGDKLYLNKKLIGWAYARGDEYSSITNNIFPVYKGDKLSGSGTVSDSLFFPQRKIETINHEYQFLYLWEKISDKNDSTVS